MYILFLFVFKDLCILAVIVTNNHDSWKSGCTIKRNIRILLKSVSLPAGKAAICILDFRLDLNVFAATHLLIKKKKMNLNAIAHALVTILRFAVVLGGTACIRYNHKEFIIKEKNNQLLPSGPMTNA